MVSLTAILALLAMACGSPAPPASQAPASGQPAAAPKTPIKIGAMFSTTGPLAGAGAEALPGAQVFADEINAKGGINGRLVELVVHNDESKPEGGLSGVRKLVDQDKVVAIVGPVSVAVSTAMTPILDEKKVPMVGLLGQFGEMTPYSFSAIPVTGVTVPHIQYAKSKGLKTAALIAQAGAIAESIKRTVQPDLEKEMTLVAFEQIQPTDTDITPILAKLRSQGVEFVFVPTSGQQAAMAAKNFKQIAYPGLFSTTHQNANATFIDLVGDAADIVIINGTKIAVYKDLPASDPDKARVSAFADAYLKKTGKEPSLISAVGYDMMLSVTEAIKTAGDNPEKIKEALEAQKGLKGLNGVINRSPKEHNGMEAQWLLMGVDAAQKRFVIKK